jgi:hypothetical protein
MGRRICEFVLTVMSFRGLLLHSLLRYVKSEPQGKYTHTHASARLSAYCSDFNHKVPRIRRYVCCEALKSSQRQRSHVCHDVPKFSSLSMAARAAVVSGRVAGRSERCALHYLGVWENKHETAF